MSAISKQVIEEFLAPILAAQIFLFVFIYFTLVKRRIASEYGLYACFLLSFILFLVTRPLQLWSMSMDSVNLVYIRMFMFFAVVLPSILLAVLSHSGIPKSRSLYFGSFVGGVTFAGVYMLLIAAGSRHFGMEPSVFGWLAPEGWDLTDLAHAAQITAAFVYLIIPCGLLLYRELNSEHRTSLLIFLVSALLFGCIMTIGTLFRQHGLYYAGSVVFAASWAWVVYKDINDLKGRVTLLNEELQYLVQSGPNSVVPEIEHLLADLEELSIGNMSVYKMRIRTILGMLTDVTIQAGGDSEQLAARNESLVSEIESLSDPDQMSQILRSEAVELSEMIAEIPDKRTNAIVVKAKRQIEANYTQDLSVDSIAEALNLSRAHFMREFKKGAGQTVNQFLTHFRIEQAKRMLAEKTVTETAFDVGFNDSNYFSTVFKKTTGVSPGEFQKSLETASSEDEPVSSR
ncbi:MAG: AraC family transcriptional regulator [Verrucomicrobiota bacterium]